MTVDDRRRLELYEAARTSLGEAAAGTLMEMLPVDATELVTKHDLELLRLETRADFAALRAEMHELFREQTNRILMFVLPTMLSGIGLAFAAARLG
jgi:hypothetical protein